MQEIFCRLSRALLVSWVVLVCNASAVLAQNSYLTVQAAVTSAKGDNASNGLETLDQKGPQWTDYGESKTVAVAYEPAQRLAGQKLERVAVISLKSGDNVVSEASIPASAPLFNGRVYVLSNGPVNTGLAIANDQNQPAVISFYFTDGTGLNFGQGSFTLDAKRNIAAFVNQPPFNLQSTLEGSLTFSSSIPVAVTALRGFTNERGEFLMTTLAIGSVQADVDRPFIVLPQFVDGGGWSTQVVLMNPTDTPLAGRVQFFDAGSPAEAGSPLTLMVNGSKGTEFNYAIAPRSVARLVTTNSSPDVHFGYVVVSAAGRNPVPQGISILSFSNEGITVTETGVQTASLETAFETYFRTHGSVRSVFAIANPSGLLAHTTLELTDIDNPATRLTAFIDIPAGGYISEFIDELFPNVGGGFQGKLSILSTQPVAVTGLRVRYNARGDVLITSVPATNDTPTGMESGLVFPLVVRGGGYSTEFIGGNK